MDTTKRHIHDRSVSWFGTSTSIKSDRIKLASWATPFPIVEGCGHASVVYIRVKYHPLHVIGLSALVDKLVSVLI